MQVTDLYEKVNDLYERYRSIEADMQPEQIKLFDNTLYFSSELVDIIKQLKTED